MVRNEALSFDEFRTRLADLLGLDAAHMVPEAQFVADLGVDSLRMVEALLRLQELGVELSPDLAWEMQTVGDAYRFYQQTAAQPR